MLAWVAQNAIVTLVLAVLVSIFCRVGRLGPASRHALWLVVLIKLVTPPLVAWPWAVPIVAGPWDTRGGLDTAAAVDSARLDYVVSSETITLSVPHAAERASPVPAPFELPLPGSADESVGTPWAAVEMNWVVLAYVVWIAVALAVAGLHSVRIFRMHRLAVRAESAPEWLLEETASAAALLRIRPPRVAVVADLATPLVWSLGRATLLWPAGLAQSGRADAWRGVIVHELAHLRRRDHWTGWLELASGCLWWFHPVFWYARHQVRENAELACDAWVVRLLPDGRRSYAEALVSVCEFGSPAVPPPVPALGVHSGARRSLERRLTMILRERFPVRVSRGAWIALVLLAVAAVPNWYLVAQAQRVSTEAAPILADPEIAAAEAAEGATPAKAAVEIPSIASEEAVVEAVGDVTIPGRSHAPAEPLPIYGRPIQEPEKPSRVDRNPSGQHVVESDSFTFTRTTYRVPEHVAQRLQNFLEQNLSWPHVMDAVVYDEPADPGEAFARSNKHLTVTASPAAQEVIGNLVGLMLESKPRDSGSRYLPPALEPLGGVK